MSKISAHNVELYAFNFFSDKYISYKYQLSDRYWYSDLKHLLGKVQMKMSELFLCSPTASNVVELCSLRDSIVICNTIDNKDTFKLTNLLCTDIILFYSHACCSNLLFVYTL